MNKVRVQRSMNISILDKDGRLYIIGINLFGESWILYVSMGFIC